jgi:PP-loop superfamily ATP-utilizing enzyme
MKRVVCYSGGHSSGLVAIEVARRYAGDEIVLLNHDLPFWTEDADIKRFKREVADYLSHMRAMPTSSWISST